MKRNLVIILAIVLALGASLVAGCGDEGDETTTTTMMEATTTEMQQSTTSTEGSTTTAPESTTTTEEAGGVDIPLATPGEYTDLTPEQAKYLIDTELDLVVIDVSPHYDEGHVPGAVSYYLGDGSLEAAIPTLDPDVPYLVYCHVDSVAIAGAQMLVDAGFTTVYRLEGNYSAWVAAGYPVEK